MARKNSVLVWIDIGFEDTLNEVKMLLKKSRRGCISHAQITRAINRRINIKDLVEDELIRL